MTAGCGVKAFSRIISLIMIRVGCQNYNQLQQLFRISSTVRAVLRKSQKAKEVLKSANYFCSCDLLYDEVHRGAFSSDCGSEGYV